MKRNVARMLLAFGMVILVVIGSAGVSEAFTITVKNSQTTVDSNGGISQNSMELAVFTATETYFANAVDVNVSSYSSQAGRYNGFEIGLAEVNNDNSFVSGSLGALNTWSGYDAMDLSGSQGWLHIPFYGIKVEAGHNYAVYIAGVPGGASYSFYWYCHANTTGGRSKVYGGAWSNVNTPGFRVYGYTVDRPFVNTGDASQNSDGLYLNGSITTLNFGTSASCYFEYGTATGIYDFVSEKASVGELGGHFACKVNPVVGTYYYRAKAEGDFGVIEGSEKSYTVTSVSVAKITTLKAKNITYKSFAVGASVENLGVDSDVDVSFDYGDTPEMVNNQMLATGMDWTGETAFYSVTAESNTHYYYQAKMVHDTDVTRGEIRELDTWDPNKGSLMNQANNWVNKLGIGGAAWWLLLLVFLGLEWGFMHENKAVATVASIVTLGAFIAAGAINPWIVLALCVVVAVVAASAAFRAVFGG